MKIEPIAIGGHTYQIRSLLDRDQFYDPEGLAAARGVFEGTWSYFGVVWGAGLRLAEYASHHPLAGKRILELGCGLALGGLVCNRRGADITASDRHPLAAEFLRANLALNGLAPMPFVDIDWTAPPPALGRFDSLIASDVLYESGHPLELGRFVEEHLAPGGEVVVVDPGRGGSGRLGRALARLGLEGRDADPEASGRIRVVRYAT